MNPVAQISLSDWFIDEQAIVIYKEPHQFHFNLFGILTLCLSPLKWQPYAFPEYPCKWYKFVPWINFSSLSGFIYWNLASFIIATLIPFCLHCSSLSVLPIIWSSLEGTSKVVMCIQVPTYYFFFEPLQYQFVLYLYFMLWRLVINLSSIRSYSFWSQCRKTIRKTKITIAAYKATCRKYSSQKDNEKTPNRIL